MPTHDIVDPAVAEADQRAERAKASLLSRVERLKHRLSDATHTLDLPAQIAKRPLPAVGIAFAIGVVAGLRRGRPVMSGDVAERSFSGIALTGLTTVGLRIVRELAMIQLGKLAKQWWTEQEHGSPVDLAGGRTPYIAPRAER